MTILIVIFLAIIAYYLWKIYQQREDEQIQIHNEKQDIEWEKSRKEKFKQYPHLYGKLEGNWLDVFAMHYEDGTPLLKMSFLLMLGESCKLEFSEGSMKWDNLWNCSIELLEHLEKYHEGSLAEHEIAIVTYWQIAAEAMGKLREENPEIEGCKVEEEPFTNINHITTLFPHKKNHPHQEISFFAEDGSFPRKSTRSDHMNTRLEAQGV